MQDTPICTICKLARGGILSLHIDGLFVYFSCLCDVATHSETQMNYESPRLGTTYQSVLGAVINALRTSGGKIITQSDIANCLGVTVSTWSRIERGESALSLEQLLEVALFLNLPLSKLFQNVEEQIENIKKQGISVAVSKDALAGENILQLSNSQLINMGFLAAKPIIGVGLAAFGAYMMLLRANKGDK